MGGRPCMEKIILNSGGIANQAILLNSRVQAPGIEISDDKGYEIVKHLNAAEDAVFQATRIFLESQGYDGPWPHSLTGGKHDY